MASKRGLVASNADVAEPTISDFGEEGVVLFDAWFGDVGFDLFLDRGSIGYFDVVWGFFFAHCEAQSPFVVFGFGDYEGLGPETCEFAVDELVGPRPANGVGFGGRVVFHELFRHLDGVHAMDSTFVACLCVAGLA